MSKARASGSGTAPSRSLTVTGLRSIRGVTSQTRRPARYLTAEPSDGPTNAVADALRSFLDHPSRSGYLAVELDRHLVPSGMPSDGVQVVFRIRAWNRGSLVGTLFVGRLRLEAEKEAALRADGWTRRPRESSWERLWRIPVDLARVSSDILVARELLLPDQRAPITFSDRAEVQRRYHWWKDPEARSVTVLFVAVVGLFVIVIPILVVGGLLLGRHPPPRPEVVAVDVLGAPVAGAVFAVVFDKSLAALGRRRRPPVRPASALAATPTLGAILWTLIVLAILDPR